MEKKKKQFFNLIFLCYTSADVKERATKFRFQSGSLNLSFMSHFHSLLTHAHTHTQTHNLKFIIVLQQTQFIHLWPPSFSLGYNNEIKLLFFWKKSSWESFKKQLEKVCLESQLSKRPSSLFFALKVSISSTFLRENFLYKHHFGSFF